MKSNQSPPRKKEVKSNLLQQNDLVILSRRFFVNHQILYRDLGVGIVLEVRLPTPKSLPSILVRFQYNKFFFIDFLVSSKLEYHLEEGIMIFRIHPLYLEKMENKYGSKKAQINSGNARKTF